LDFVGLASTAPVRTRERNLLSDIPSSPPLAPVAANATVQLVVSPSNGLATSGFVVSLIAAVFSIIPIIGVVS
jgi:hypothetical protein